MTQTYCVDSQVADSACSATAFLCGVKANRDTIGLDANAIYQNCDTQNAPENRVDSIMLWAQVLSYNLYILDHWECTYQTQHV